VLVTVWVFIGDRF